ncbi:MAG: ribonuclease H-like domain-containing protein, partial [Chloroflexota bacterium]
MDESLFNRLKSLGVQLGASQSTPPSKKDATAIPIENVVPGKEYPTIFGGTYLVENCYPASYSHGNIAMNNPVDLTALLNWSRLSDSGLNLREKFLFLDTETSGLIGGAGTIVFMVGLGYWQGDEYRLTQLFLRDPEEEPSFLTALEEIITAFPVLVTYNGKSFDAPLLNNRFILNGFKSPLREKHHIDLLSLTRRVWRNRLESRSLGNLEQEILTVSRGQEEIPGWMVPELYFQYLQTRNASPLSGVFYHNQMDILSLSALFLHLADLLMDPLRSEHPQ